MMWNIHFSQINACSVEVSAGCKAEAMTKAIKKWKEDVFPHISNVEMME